MNKIIAVIFSLVLIAITVDSMLSGIINRYQNQSIEIQRNTLSLQSSRISRLERIIEKQGAMLDWNGRRITQLERPDEPVFPPRHPGRIGSIDSSEISSDK